MSIKSGMAASYKGTSILDDRKNPQAMNHGIERSQKILDQSSQEVLDYLGNFETSFETKGPPPL